MKKAFLWTLIASIQIAINLNFIKYLCTQHFKLLFTTSNIYKFQGRGNHTLEWSNNKSKSKTMQMH